tara:strand:- start:1110 stop:1298 length:189 start_codon:yes stop_codon:yes gene_type:complete
MDIVKILFSTAITVWLISSGYTAKHNFMNQAKQELVYQFDEKNKIILKNYNFKQNHKIEREI